MARKNGMTGAIPGAGRPAGLTEDTVIVNLRISKEAKAVLESLPRMQRGKFVSEVILKHKL